MLRIGLTGGIASGKTTVSEHFSKLGATVIDADQIARQVMEIGQKAYSLIIDAFGPEVLNQNKEIDRDYLRRRVFDDNEERKRLEAIVHPLVRNEIQKKTQELDEGYCIIVVPLLVEAGYFDLIDRILVVDTTIENQQERLKARSGLDQEQIKKIMASQVDRKTRLSHADDVIENNSDIKKLEEQVESLHQKYLKLASEHKV